MLEEGGGKRAVLAVAVIGRGPFLRRVGNDGSGRRLDPRQAAAERARLRPDTHRGGKRVVAAGIENEQARAPRPVESAQGERDGDRLVENVEIGRKPGIDGDEEVLAVEFHAVAGVVNDGDIGAAGFAGELAEGTTHCIEAEVGLVANVETEAGERLADRLGVVDRIGERGDVFIIGIADDQRHPLVGISGARKAGDPKSRDSQQA